jgi:hypothetical protein
MSASEYYELVLQIEASIDAQFEFWLTVTFATVVATYMADNQLTRSLRAVIASAYLLASAVVTSRWYYDASKIVGLSETLDNQYEAFPVPEVTIIARVLLVVGGSVATLYFVCFGFPQDKDRGDRPT